MLYYAKIREAVLFNYSKARRLDERKIANGSDVRGPSWNLEL